MKIWVHKTSGRKQYWSKRNYPFRVSWEIEFLTLLSGLCNNTNLKDTTVRWHTSVHSNIVRTMEREWCVGAIKEKVISAVMEDEANDVVET